MRDKGPVAPPPVGSQAGRVEPGNWDRNRDRDRLGSRRQALPERPVPIYYTIIC